MKTAGFQPRSLWVRFVSSPFFLVGMIGVILGILWVSGLVNPCWFGVNCAPSTEGLIAVPVSAHTIPAFTQLNRQHVWNAGKGQLSVVLLPPEQVTDVMKTDLTHILGRVLGREKPAGYVFTESDFLPPGSRPGLVGGIPPGKRAVRVEANQVTGLYGLNSGDRFDLIATLPINADGKGKSLTMGGAYGDQLALQADLLNWDKQATVRVLVQNGVLVQPLTTREIPLSMNTLTQGLVVKKKPVQEIVIAVDPEEVALLTEAMAVKAEITTIPRSGHPDDPRDSHTPESQPWSPFGTTMTMGKPSGDVSRNGDKNGSLTLVETMNGSGERHFIAVPVATDEP